MSSMHSAVWANNSLTSMPLLPYFRNLNGDRRAPLVLRSVRRLGPGSGLPWKRSRSGLGSKVSTWEGPPFMNRWTTRWAFGGNCGFFGASGLMSVEAARAGVLSRPSDSSTPASPRRPKPMPLRRRSSRRVSNGSSMHGGSDIAAFSPTDGCLRSLAPFPFHKFRRARLALPFAAAGLVPVERRVQHYAQATTAAPRPHRACPGGAQGSALRAGHHCRSSPPPGLPRWSGAWQLHPVGTSPRSTGASPAGAKGGTADLVHKPALHRAKPGGG